MVKIMAVYDEDPLYARRLAEYVNQRETIPFTAMAFSDLERLEEYGNEHEIEILLVGESVRRAADTVRAGLKLVLCGGEFSVEKEEPSIYKFQSGESILQEVMTCYCAAPPEPALALAGMGAQILGVYSPVNRCGKTAFALTLAQVLSRTRSVLFISLEEFAGFEAILGGEVKRDFSDVLYLCRQGSFNWMKLRAMVCSAGQVDMIPPAAYGEDLDQVEPEELAQLLGRIARESGYGRLVVDLGHMGRGSAALLDCCDGVYMPVLEDPVSRAKLEAFDRYLSAAGAVSLREKICRIRLPGIRPLGSMENYMDQLLWGEMGDFVRSLLEGGGKNG